MILEEVIEHCLSYPSSYEDHPFGEGWTAIRHKGNQKLFVLITTHNGHLIMNLKCSPERSDLLREQYKDVQPAYHMNKKHWNTVVLDGSLEEEDIHDMVKHSFDLTRSKVRHRSKMNKTEETHESGTPE